MITNDILHDVYVREIKSCRSAPEEEKLAEHGRGAKYHVSTNSNDNHNVLEKRKHPRKNKKTAIV